MFALKRTLALTSQTRSFSTVMKPKLETIAVPSQKSTENLSEAMLNKYEFEFDYMGAWEFSQLEFDPRSINQFVHEIRHTNVAKAL